MKAIVIGAGIGGFKRGSGAQTVGDRLRRL
mgnify:CR=1 FL=1